MADPRLIEVATECRRLEREVSDAEWNDDPRLGGCSMSQTSSPEERCWAYLLANRQATAEDVALNCDVTEVFAEALMARISSENWREPTINQQVGGSHYKDMDVQPWQAMEAWLTPEEYRGYHKAVAIGYLARERQKGGLQDIEKAIHHLQRLVEIEHDRDTKTD